MVVGNDLSYEIHTKDKVDAIEIDTQDLQTQIGTAGIGLTQLGGMSVAMKGEVNDECDTALADYDAPTKAELDTAEANIISAVTGLSGIRKTTFSAPVGSEGAVAYEASTWKDVHVVASATKDVYVKGLVITNSGTPTNPVYRFTIAGNHAFPYSTAGNPVLTGAVDQFDMPIIIEAGQAWKIQVNCTTANGNATVDEVDLIELG